MTTTTTSADLSTCPGDGVIAQLRDLHVTFRRRGRAVHALRGVSLEIRRGEILGLVGESGSGKSVLGSALMGLLPATATVTGEATVAGVDMTTSPEEARRGVRRLDLGVVFQDPMTSLNPTMTIGRQVVEVAGSQEEAVRLLRAVGVPEPEGRLTSYPHQLSGGLRQRVMIAMAVAGDPALIIADEPTTALDVTVQAQVLTLLARLRDELGCSIIMVTHDLGVAAQIADRVAVMYAGRLAEVGPAADVMHAGAHPYTLGLLGARLTLDAPRDAQLVALPGEMPSPIAPLTGCAFAPRCAVATEQCTQVDPEVTTVASGHVRACHRDLATVRAAYAAAERDAAPVEARQTSASAEGDAEQLLVSARFVTKSYHVKGTRRRSHQLFALRGVSLDIERGESVALVGESGSGKSTLLRVIAGLEPHDSGDLDVPGDERPQMVFQDAGASLTPWLSVGEIIGERLQGRGMSRRERETTVEHALTRVGLPAETASARSRQLSGGQRQRVALARATVVPPPLLLCDEPTSALDVSLAAGVINLISGLRAELGMSVLFVTHDLSVARVVADRIAVMYLGRIVEIGTADEVTRNPVHPYTRSLIAAIPDLGRTPPPITGEPASPLSPPAGCAFHPRCPMAVPACGDPDLQVPLTLLPGTDRRVACTEVHRDGTPAAPSPSTPPGTASAGQDATPKAS